MLLWPRLAMRGPTTLGGYCEVGVHDCGFAVYISLALTKLHAEVKGQATVKSSSAATAAQSAAFVGHLSQFGPLANLKAQLAVDKKLLCQGKFKNEKGQTSLAKTFFKDDGNLPAGIVLEEGYLGLSQSLQFLIAYQELRRLCYGFRRHPAPSGAGLAVPDECKDAVSKIHRSTNSAIDAAQDAENRAGASGMQAPPGANNGVFQTELNEYCAGARPALEDAKDRKKLLRIAAQVFKNIDVTNPPAEPGAVDQYILDGYSRLCRSISLAEAAVAAAGK